MPIKFRKNVCVEIQVLWELESPGSGPVGVGKVQVQVLLGLTSKGSGPAGVDKSSFRSCWA